MKPTLALSFCLIGGLSACQPPPTTSSVGLPSSSISTPANSEGAAKAAVARYVRALPNAPVYQLDQARAVEVDTYWQVLVPRSDWATRMPNSAAFSVDKSTGSVTAHAVK